MWYKKKKILQSERWHIFYWREIHKTRESSEWEFIAHGTQVVHWEASWSGGEKELQHATSISWVMSYGCHLWKVFWRFLLRTKTTRMEIEWMCGNSLLSPNNWVVLLVCFTCSSVFLIHGGCFIHKISIRTLYSSWRILCFGGSRHRIQGYFEDWEYIDNFHTYCSKNNPIPLTTCCSVVFSS